MTSDQRKLRADWLLESLTAIHRNEARWTPFPPNHNPQTANLGRFHTPTQQWWPETREDAGAPRPMYMTIRIPPEPRIEYPGEEITITPTQVRDIINAMKRHDVYHSFITYTRGDNPASVAYYNERTKRVEWGMQPNDVRHAALLASDYVPFNPNCINP